MIGIYDKNDVLITKLVDTALSYPDVTEIKNRTLDGRWHIQTIGEGATVLSVKAHLKLKEKDTMDHLHRTKDLFKVIFDGKYYVGILDGKPDYDRMKSASYPMFGCTFTMMVREEGNS